MELLKSAILTASIIGIISLIADFAAPGEALKKQLKTIITMILILGLFTPFLGSGFRINLDGGSALSDNNVFKKMDGDIQDYYISDTQENLERAVKQELERQGIEVEKISIHCSLAEYNSIEITETEITVAAGTDTDYAAEAAQSLLPDDCRIIVTEVSGDSQEY